jgi:hypothetical protein
MSQSSSRSSSFVSRLPAVLPSSDPCSRAYSLQLGDVEPYRRVQPARHVRDGDDRCAECAQLHGGHAADVAEPWTTQRWSGKRPAEAVAGARDHHHNARSGRLLSEDRAADRDGLAGDDLRDRIARCIEYVSIIHAIVCSFVAMSGAGMSSLRPDERQELGGETSRETLELPLGQGVRVAADPALRATVGKPEERALPRHPHRERGALAERHLGS